METVNTKLAFPSDKLILTTLQTQFGIFKSLGVANHLRSAKCYQVLLMRIQLSFNTRHDAEPRSSCLRSAHSFEFLSFIPGGV